MGFDLGDLRCDFVGRRLEIELRLDVHPERRRGAEELAETKRGVGGDGRLLAGHPLDAGARHAELGLQSRRASASAAS